MILWQDAKGTIIQGPNDSKTALARFTNDELKAELIRRHLQIQLEPIQEGEENEKDSNISGISRSTPYH